MSISRSQAWGLSQMVKLQGCQCCRQRDILPPSTINTAARPKKVTQIMGYWRFRGSSFKIFPTQSSPKCSPSWRLWYKIICMKTQLWSQCNLALAGCYCYCSIAKIRMKYLWYCKREQRQWFSSAQGFCATYIRQTPYYKPPLAILHFVLDSLDLFHTYITFLKSQLYSSRIASGDVNNF